MRCCAKDELIHETRRVDLDNARACSISLLLDERGLPEEGFAQLLAADSEGR